MVIFSKINNMIKAKANNALDKAENPIESLEEKIRNMEEDLHNAKLSAAEVLGNVHFLEEKKQDAKSQMEDYETKIKKALSIGNEELAKKALEKKIEAEKQYKHLESKHAEAKKNAEKLKSRLADLEKSISETRQYRDEANARLNTAEASQKVNEILCNVSSDNINLDDIERKISKKETTAAGLEDLKPVSLDNEFDKLNEVDLDAELEKYKS
ncbi:PspA/IM30 family protein [Clostridium botulinum]|uniref:PspA/IM30 family protein n=1 Tax=Clostridium botulinum TaxID=1491 RepID=A0A6G4EW97_CLOBO|nr:PspA/IM30 family protein [Clostridium botulinum]